MPLTNYRSYLELICTTWVRFTFTYFRYYFLQKAYISNHEYLSLERLNLTLYTVTRRPQFRCPETNAETTASFYSARNARIASAVLATAIPSVCLSVCPSVRPFVHLSHAGIVSKRRHVAQYAVCTVGEQNVSSFVETKKYCPGTTPSPEILAQSDLPTPEGSEF